MNATAPDGAPNLGRIEEPGRERGRRAGYVASIVINFVWLYVAHHLLDWKVPFLTPAFADVLWAIDLSLEATILANLTFLVYDARWFRGLVQIGLTGIAFVVTAILYSWFPFDFGTPVGNELAHLGLVLVMVCLAIAVVVQTIVLIVEQVRGVSPPANR